MRDVLIPSAIAAAAVAAAWGLTPDGSPGFDTRVVRVGVLVILGAGLLGAVAGAPSRVVLTRECIAMAVGSAAAGWMVGDVPTAALVAVAWLIPWSIGLPARAAGWTGAGRLLTLASAATLYATPYFVPRTWPDLPTWVLTWNPLVRLHGSVHHEDWFHGPTLYGRVGERFYIYPDVAAELAGPAGLVGAALATAAAVGMARRRYCVLRGRQD